MNDEKLTKEQKKKLEELERIKENQGEAEKISGLGRGGKIEFSTKGVYRSIFNQMLVARYGEKWALSPVELDGISKATDDLLVKYAPYLAKWGAEVNFGFWLFLILSPRLEYKQQQPKKILGEKIPASKEKTEKKKGV